MSVRQLDVVVASQAEAVHEANNLLQAITAEARLLAERASRDADRVLLDRIIEQAMSLADVLARLGAGATHEARARSIEVERLVESALEVVDARARAAGVTLAHDVALGLRVLARGSGLEHALVNLLVNSIQAIESADDLAPARRRVTVTARPGAPGRVRLSVHDQGPGVPDSLRPLLLLAVVTTKRRGQGSGLGLLLVRRLVEEHGGSVTLESRPGELTEVTIDLPAVAHERR